MVSASIIITSVLLARFDNLSTSTSCSNTLILLFSQDILALLIIFSEWYLAPSECWFPEVWTQEYLPCVAVPSFTIEPPCTSTVPFPYATTPDIWQLLLLARFDNFLTSGKCSNTLYSSNRYVVDTGATADDKIIKNGTKGCLIVGGTDSNVTISNGTIVNEASTSVYAVVGTNNGHL